MVQQNAWRIGSLFLRTIWRARLSWVSYAMRMNKKTEFFTITQSPILMHMDGHTCVTLYGMDHRIALDGCVVDASPPHIVWWPCCEKWLKSLTTQQTRKCQSCISCMCILGLASNHFFGVGVGSGVAGPEYFFSTVVNLFLIFFVFFSFENKLCEPSTFSVSVCRQFSLHGT